MIETINYISASEIATRIYDVLGLKIYELDSCYLKKNEIEGDEFIWQFVDAGILKETANYGLGGSTGCGWDIFDFGYLCPKFSDIKNGNISINQQTIYDVCVLYRHWTWNYYHFFTEVVDKIIIMERGGFGGRYLLCHNSYIESVINILGIDSKRIIWADSINNDVFLARKVFIPEAITCDSGRTLPILCEWADKLGNFIKKENKMEYPNKINVVRIGKRKLLGSEKIFKKYGFVSIIPEELSMIEQFSYFMNADVVISPHGANTTNALFMKKNAVLIESFGCDYVNSSYFQIVKYKELRYRMLVEPHFHKIKRCGNYVHKLYDQHSSDDYIIDDVLWDITLREL